MSKAPVDGGISASDTLVDPVGSRTAPDRVGRVLANRFELRALLGSGGMGSVYLAHDRQLDEDVAVKLLHERLSSSEEALALLRHEVKLARRVTHTNVARIHELVQDDGRWFLTMELVDGVALSDMMSREGRLPPTRVVELLAAVCSGLEAVHQAGVVHGDVKPANILVARDGRVVLSDFGIAQFADATTDTDEVMGTPAYMAPEQVTGASLGPQADLYAVGIIAFELLAGKLPFRGRNAIEIASARLVQDPPALIELCPEVDNELLAVVHRALARDPGERQSSAAALQRELTTPSLASVRTIDSIDIVELYLEAQSLYRRFELVDQAVAMFAEACDAAPDSPVVHAGYALALTRSWMMLGGNTAQCPEAEGAVARAMELGPHLGETHLARGMLALHMGHPVRAAEAFQAALTIAPSLPDGHAIACTMLFEASCLDEAERRLEIAMRLNPGLHTVEIERARVAALRGDRALAEAFIAREHPPGSVDLLMAGRFAAYFRDASALERLRAASNIGKPVNPTTATVLFGRIIDVLAGATPAERLYQLLPTVSTTTSLRRQAITMQLRSEIAALHGDDDIALESLEAASASGLLDLLWLEGCPLLAPLRDHPRFSEVVRQVRDRAQKVVRAFRVDVTEHSRARR